MSEANGPKKRKMSLEKRHNLTGWAFLAPATIMIAIMSFWPMIQALILSFQTGKANNLEFGGLTNYIRMFKDKVFIFHVIYISFNVLTKALLPIF